MQEEFDGEEVAPTDLSKGLKIANSCLTLIILVQVVELHRVKLENMLSDIHEENEERERIAHRGMSAADPHKRKKYHLHRLRASRWDMWWFSSMSWKFWVAFIVMIPHPVSFWPDADVLLTLWMMFRLYVFVEAYKVHSWVWRERTILKRAPAFQPDLAPNINTKFVMRVLFYRHAIALIGCATLFGILYCAYGIYLFERVAQPDLFDFGGSVFLSFYALFTGYPADGFDVYVPVTWGAKLIACFELVYGLFLFALVIEYIHTEMRPNAFEESALRWADQRHALRREREESARLIQYVWFSYKFECWAEEEHLGDEDPQYLRGTTYHEKRCHKQMQVVKRLRRKQREKGVVGRDAVAPAERPKPAAGAEGEAGSTDEHIMKLLGLLRTQLTAQIDTKFNQHLQAMQRLLEARGIAVPAEPVSLPATVLSPFPAMRLREQPHGGLHGRPGTPLTGGLGLGARVASPMFNHPAAPVPPAPAPAEINETLTRPETPLSPVMGGPSVALGRLIDVDGTHADSGGGVGNVQ